MKKFIMMAVMAVVAVSASAQVWLGGELGFNTNKTSIDSNELSTSTSFEIAPELGYKINENWDIAIKLGYSYSDSGASNVLGLKESGSANAFTIKPFVRYTFVRVGNFSAFCDGGVDYSTIHIKGAENNINGFGVGLNPGISYEISPKVALDAHFGDLSYSHTWCDKLTNDAFNLSLKNTVTFGIIVEL